MNDEQGNFPRQLVYPPTGSTVTADEIFIGEPIGIPGWFSAENRAALGRLIEFHNVKSVVEVGSFLGLSAVWFAQRVEQVYCVDTWFEPATHESDNNLVGTLRRWGLPRDFFHLFAENVMRSGVWHKVCPIKGGSHHVIGEVPIADLVYLDAGHTYEQVKQDILDYRDKARIILCGDDYTERREIDGSPCFGVIQAITELLPRHQSNGPFWWCDMEAERR